jgi:hypothetical protein
MTDVKISDLERMEEALLRKCDNGDLWTAAEAQRMEWCIAMRKKYFPNEGKPEAKGTP